MPVFPGANRRDRSSSGLTLCVNRATASRGDGLGGGGLDSRLDSLDSFDSGLLDPGDNWQLDTSTPGTYSYFCALHPDMTANIIVN